MKIIGIHGIGQTFEGAATIKQKWLPALQCGLTEAGAAPIRDEDFSMVSFGALFRPAGVRSGAAPKLDEKDVEEGWEQELLTQWWRAAAAQAEENRLAGGGDPRGEDPSIQGPDFEGRARTPAVVQRGLKQLAKSRFFRALGGERVLIFGLKQVRLFLHDQDMKREIIQRVRDLVMPETKVIVAHSLGSIVAYEALCAHPEWNVRALVTLGSPLGIPNTVFDSLTPKPQGGRGAWPNVKQWINIADKGDLVALQKELARTFRPGQRSSDLQRLACPFV